MGMQYTFPTVTDFQNALAVAFPNQLVEVIRQPLYDSALYPTAGMTVLPFFQTPIGQGASSTPGNAGNVKTLQDTNMQLGGQLPAGVGFYAETIEVDFQPGSVNTAATFTPQAPIETGVIAITLDAGIRDVNLFYTGGGVTFSILNKAYYQDAPILRFPPKARFELESSSSQAGAVADTALVAAKLRAGGNLCKLNPGIGLQSNATFNVTLNWPAVQATPSGFNGRVMVTLDGWMFRPVQ